MHFRENRDIGHNVEYLKQIYHYNRYTELKELFKKILNKRIELKKDFLQDDIEIDETLNSSESFTPVVKKKKNSRKKH